MNRHAIAPAAGAAAAAAASPIGPLSLRIERLALHGLPLGRDGGARVQTALGAELGRLLEGAVLRGELRHGAVLAALPVRGLTLEAGAGPERLGQQLAQALFDGLVPQQQAGTAMVADHD